MLTLRPHWGRLGQDVTAPHRWLDRVGPDQAALTLASAALWCVALWLAIGLGAVAAAAVPGRVGAIARRIAARVLPAVVLRALAGVAGLGVLMTPIASVAASGHMPGGPASAIAAATPAPTWPTDARPLPHVHIGWPTNQPPSTQPRPPTTHAPQLPTSQPSKGRDHNDRATPTRASGDGPVRVEPGDSLWLIAAQRLGPTASDAQIAAAWPRWYAANRPVIGDDPSHIEPGQVLHAPPPSDATR
jgi:nucleoid-associated protein YgaU